MNTENNPEKIEVIGAAGKKIRTELQSPGVFSMTALAILLFLIALLPRLYKLDRHDLWSAEWWTLFAINLPFREMMELLWIDVFPPLYFFLLRPFMYIGSFFSSQLGDYMELLSKTEPVFLAFLKPGLFHYDYVYIARLFSALAGAGTAVLVFMSASLLYGFETGITAGLLLCFSPFAIHFSQEARTYSFLSFMASLSFFFFILTIRYPSRITLAYYTLVTSLLLYTHHHGLFVFLGQIVVFFLFFNYRTTTPVPQSSDTYMTISECDRAAHAVSQGKCADKHIQGRSGANTPLSCEIFREEKEKASLLKIFSADLTGDRLQKGPFILAIFFILLFSLPSLLMGSVQSGKVLSERGTFNSFQILISFFESFFLFYPSGTVPSESSAFTVLLCCLFLRPFLSRKRSPFLLAPQIIVLTHLLAISFVSAFFVNITGLQYLMASLPLYIISIASGLHISRKNSLSTLIERSIALLLAIIFGSLSIVLLTDERHIHRDMSELARELHGCPASSGTLRPRLLVSPNLSFLIFLNEFLHVADRSFKPEITFKPADNLSDPSSVIAPSTLNQENTLSRAENFSIPNNYSQSGQKQDNRTSVTPENRSFRSRWPLLFSLIISISSGDITRELEVVTLEKDDRTFNRDYNPLFMDHKFIEQTGKAVFNGPKVYIARGVFSNGYMTDAFLEAISKGYRLLRRRPFYHPDMRLRIAEHPWYDLFLYEPGASDTAESFHSVISFSARTPKNMTRPLLVEISTLKNTDGFEYPRKYPGEQLFTATKNIVPDGFSGQYTKATFEVHVAKDEHLRARLLDEASGREITNLQDIYPPLPPALEFEFNINSSLPFFFSDLARTFSSLALLALVFLYFISPGPGSGHRQAIPPGSPQQPREEVS